MGLCLSKKDVLIQQPQLSLREQMLSELARDSHDLMTLDSPSTSMLSVDSSSVLVSSEKHLLKIGSAGSSSMLRSSSNVAECGSVAEWRTEQASPDGSSSSGSGSSRIHDLQSEARTSGFSYLSSPMIQGIDAYGLDNIAKSYAEARQKSKEKFELDGGFGLGSKQHRKLLEIHKEEDEEEDDRTEVEDEDDNDDDGCSKEDVVPELRTTKKTTTRSLHVFGEVFGDRTPETKQTVAAFASKLRSCGVETEIGVFGAERYFKRSDFDERVKLQKNRHHLGGFQKSDSPSDLDATASAVSESEADSELARSRLQQHQCHQRWGFCLDSGSEEEDSVSHVSSTTTSTQVESLKCSRKKPSASAFMAVPRSEMWPNFAHMNPVSGDHSSSGFAKRPYAKEFLGIHHEQQGANAEYRASFSTDDISSTTYGTDSGDEYFKGSNSRGFLRGFAAMPLEANLFKPKSHLRNPGFSDSAFAARSSSASISSSLFEEDEKAQQGLKMHFPSRKLKRFDEEDDDGSDSDNSNDLFEIETLEAALGSLSSSSDKEFVYPKNKAFLRDPDISYSTDLSSMRNHHQYRGGGNKPVLGPTLRANVIVSSKRKSEEQHRPESFRGSSYYCRDDLAKDPKKQSLYGAAANSATGDLENKSSILYRGLGIYGR